MSWYVDSAKMVLAFTLFQQVLVLEFVNGFVYLFRSIWCYPPLQQQSVLTRLPNCKYLCLETAVILFQKYT